MFKSNTGGVGCFGAIIQVFEQVKLPQRQSSCFQQHPGVAAGLYISPSDGKQLPLHQKGTEHMPQRSGSITFFKYKVML
jgi:hypothetical protein